MNRIKFLAGFGVGFVCASLLFVAVVVPFVIRDKYQFGFRQGHTQGLINAAISLRNEFGTIHAAPFPPNNGEGSLGGIFVRDESGVIDSNRPCKEVFSVKDVTIVSIEIDGVKTVRMND